MKEAVVDKTVTVAIRDVDTPVVQPGQVLIKVVVSGTNPKDWKVPTWRPDTPAENQGDDIAGYVEAVGAGVLNFRKGDRVAAFHEMMTAGGSYAEYAIAWAHTTFHLADEISFEEAATIPLAATTSAVGLYQQLSLPLPWHPATEPLPLVVYGGSTAVGAFAIKLACLSNIHPLIVVAGKGASYVETLIDRSKGDTIIDYREGDEAVRQKIQAAAGGRPIHHAYDAVSEKGSYHNLGAALTAPAKINVVLSGSDFKGLPEGVQILKTYCGSVHQSAAAGEMAGEAEFGAAFFAFVGRGLAQGWFRGHPHEVRPNGLAGLQGALKDLQAGKASAVKYVVRIADTPEL
ncbi:zinc-binding alcohol dehydrogenase family protein [Aspergillus saccharolyticus JOP 1030-1]|uniref:Putative quinone oxidoreductase n=1 Tax=Aspergillus saccharolyticus JOP 1030-1 TaxID=1450539 RepID=A0A318ZNN6_9EURO|nr:putative quinone oxidoreductase [Aspergillus saccharolyticus JOP 1030-1]PYH46063.1 putative quinone oxidoreductase [Aspergillus saccharolyticus JOP 1030-1]